MTTLIGLSTSLADVTGRVRQRSSWRAGEDGWELVQIVPGMNPENVVAYFKREKAE